MTANNTADTYWQGKIYQGVKFPIKNDDIFCFPSYELIGSHNFRDGQTVVEGKDYELKYQYDTVLNGYKDCSKEFYTATSALRRIVAVPLAPQNSDYELNNGNETKVYSVAAPQSEQEQVNWEQKFKDANEFICDIAKLLGEDGLGYDDLTWTIEDFKNAIDARTTPAADTVNKTQNNED